jgi:putative toxin-antitoxin system antitoxin component (TIGR02293 family)
METSTTKSKSKAAAPREVIRRKLRQAVIAQLSGAGVVKFCVQGSTASSTAIKFTPSKLIEALQLGLPFQELQVLQTSLAVPSEKLAPMLGISKATFHRSKGAASRLNSAVSDRVVRYARLLGFAVKVFGNLEDAKLWLNAPQFGLGGAVPLEYAKTEIGAREVENLLGRIQYGVYS